MAKCTECGGETELRELGTPVCTACISKRESVHPLLAELSAELPSARDLYRRAMEEFEHHQASSQHRPKGHPDRVEAARLEVIAKTAGEKYWEALRLYGETLRRQSGESGSA